MAGELVAGEAAGMLVTAERHLQEEEHRECLDCASQALEICRRDGDQAGEADAMRLKIGGHRIAALYLFTADEANGNMNPTEAETKRRDAMEEVEAMAQTERTRFAEIKEQRGEALMMLALAEILYDQKGLQKAPEAKNVAEQARQVLHDVADRRMEANAMLALVFAHAKLGEGDQASKLVAETVAAFKDLGDKLGEARALHAQAALFEGLRKDGIPFAKEAAELFREVGCKKMLASELQGIAKWYLWNHKPRDALPFALESHQLFKDISNDVDLQSRTDPELLPANQANALDTVVRCLTGKEEFEKALQWCLDAVADAQSKSDLRAEVLCLHTLIATQIDQDCNCCYPGNFVEALKAAEDGVALCQQLGNKNWEAVMHHSASLASFRMNKYEDAVDSAQKSRQMFQEFGDQRAEAAVLRTLADVHLSAGSAKGFDKASYVASEIMGIWQEQQERSKEASAMLLMAEVQHAKEVKGHSRKRTLGARQQNIDPVSYAMGALEVFQEEGKLRKAVSAWGFISRCHKHKGNVQDAVQAAQVAAEVAQFDGDFRTQARYLQETAYLLSEQHSGAATSAAEMALQAARASKSARLEVEMLILVSQTFSAKGVKDATASLTDSNTQQFQSESQALRTAREAVMLSRKLRGKHYLPWALYAFAEAQLLTGQGKQGLRAAEEAESLMHHHDDEARATCLLLVAEAHFICQNIAEAVRVGNEALQLFLNSGDTKGAARVREAMDRFQKLPTTGAAAIQDLGVLGSFAASAALKDVQVPAKEAISRVDTVQKIRAIVVDLVNDDELDDDTPLMDAGIDSLSSVEFATSLTKTFNMRIGSQIVFDFPCVAALADFLVEESQIM